MRFQLKKTVAVAVTTALLPFSVAAASPQAAQTACNPVESACKTVVCSVQGTCKDIQQYVLSLFGQKGASCAKKAGTNSTGSYYASSAASAVNSALSGVTNCPSSGTSSQVVVVTPGTSCTAGTPSASSNPAAPSSSSASSKTEAATSSKPASSAASKPASSSAAASAVSSVPAADASGLSAAESQVVTLVNQQRAANGLAPLTVNSALANMARLKSQDMIDNHYFSHQSPTYGSPFDMMKQFGISFTAAGENIAYGQPTAQAVMDAWMNSPGHRANILNSSYTQIGVGAVQNSNGTIYWTQEFIRP
ncbi:CAP domain-containing protein [Ethanoligenens harbinense]|uniref:SCP-like extracellular n=1 Tax=Ethanoligenens harbinense (strain DSM 18485 / JCM 12961 / CGMCC 1.5033 / YUAN-3) TaxID=663278 RepID=E6U427_ETHHY|nr:CAP domain-containing protein [Ethanoligenens harbinense]ADU27707.1 SCP-like extracellular [Ethanoligenens harbinense YUAN-3]